MTAVIFRSLMTAVIFRSLMTAVIVAFTVVSLCSLHPFSSNLRLAGTVLAMGGASNPYGLLMDTELDGYYSGSPGTVYEGYHYQAVPWSAQVVAYGFGTLFYDQSQAEGVAAIDAAINAALDAGTSASPVVAVGYSASAGAITKELRALQARRDAGLPAPDPADLSFIVFGNPNRPNGGILSRLPGLHIPWPLGVTFDGPIPATEYQTLDISWEYDPISDFPARPFNLLADLNAFLAFLTRHSFYYDADLTDTSSYVADVMVGNTRYVTLRRDHLPLLEVLYKWVPALAPVLDAVEPALRNVIDRAYDRTVSPAVSTPLQWGPSHQDAAVVEAPRAQVAKPRRTVKSPRTATARVASPQSRVPVDGRGRAAARNGGADVAKAGRHAA